LTDPFCATARRPEAEIMNAGTRGTYWIISILLLAATAQVVQAGGCDDLDPDAPRTLILALDGMPFRVIEQAQSQGAFADWPPVKPLISTFPSMTNVGFVALLDPFGADPIGGYEVRRYDPERNTVTGGGPVHYKHKAYSWKKQFDVMSRTLFQKSGSYFGAKKHALNELEHVEQAVLTSPKQLILAHIGATDVMVHFHQDEPVVELMLEFSERLELLRQRHLEALGRPLRVVIISDHGNVVGKVKSQGGIKSLLREAGLHPTKHLNQPNDVVPVSYGVVSYGALYLDPALAEVAARAALKHPAVNLAAWLAGERELQVRDKHGDALIRWRDEAEGRHFSYEPGTGDPLVLSAAQAGLSASGLLDSNGFAFEEDWFDTTALLEFPDAPRRLVDALTGTYVDTPATVMLSFEKGTAWGFKPARVGAWMLGGQLESTHGGLDRESTWGVFLRSDPPPRERVAIRADQALAEWSGSSGCMETLLFPH